MISNYRVGDYQAGEAHVSLRGSLDRAARVPTIIALHGRSWTAREVHQTTSLAVLLSALVEQGFGVLSIDAGQGDTWGNAASETAVGNAIAWVRGASGFAPPADKVVLLAHSMGGLVAFNYAKNHPNDIRGIVGGAPATNLARWHNDAAYGASVDAAYAGNYATNAAGRDPILYAGSFPSIPTRLYSAADDTFIPPAEVATFHNALPGTQKSLVPLSSGGHQDLWGSENPQALLEWLVNLA